MDHYLDVNILADPEFTETTIMNAAFSKLHRALVIYGKEDIGISFPYYSKRPKTLGTCLRLHGSLESLEALEAITWRKGLSDFTQVSGIQKVPDAKQYVQVSRVHAENNVENLRRRAQKRHGISYDEACERYPEETAKRLNQPFVQIKSSSTKQEFRLFIEQTKSEPHTSFCFSKYGLTNTSSVPYFK